MRFQDVPSRGRASLTVFLTAPAFFTFRGETDVVAVDFTSCRQQNKQDMTYVVSKTYIFDMSLFGTILVLEKSFSKESAILCTAAN